MAFPASEVYDVAVHGDRRRRDAVGADDVGHVHGAGRLARRAAAPLHRRCCPTRAPSTRPPRLRDFLDIFNHRLISLFYRAWEKYRFPIAYERRDEDTFSQ